MQLFSNALAWLVHIFATINILDAVKALAPLATAYIAFLALRNWKHQDKAKRQADFLDKLLEATFSYVTKMRGPITTMEMATIGMECYAPTWKASEQIENAVQGAIDFIQKNGERKAKILADELKTASASVIELKMLTVKGHVFMFKNFETCIDAVTILIGQFDRMEAFEGVLGSTTDNFENPEVLKRLKKVMAIDPNEVRNLIKMNAYAIQEFAKENYRCIYK